MDTGASLLNLDIYVTFRDLDTDLYYLGIESELEFLNNQCGLGT